MRLLFWLFAFLLPVGVHVKHPRLPRRGLAAIFWNRRGGRIIRLSDVIVNVQELVVSMLFRVRRGATFVRDADGRIRHVFESDETGRRP